MIPIDSDAYASYEQSGLQNVEFTTSPNAQGTVLDAWIESNPSSTSTSTTYWVNLPNGIGASSSITIYMNFMPSSVMSSSGPTGEAPQLSPTYAEYDDGSNVFNNYWNFAGTSLTVGTQTSGGGWSTYCPEYCVETNYASQNNGLTINFPASGNNYDFFWAANFTAPAVFDWYGTPYTPSEGADGENGNDGGWGFGLGNEGSDYGVAPAVGMGSYAISYLNYYLDDDISLAANWPVNPPTKGIYTVINSGTAVGMLDYANSVSQSITPKNLNIGWSFGYGAYYGNYTIQWARVRAYPPNGVMPSVSFGSVS